MLYTSKAYIAVQFVREYLSFRQYSTHYFVQVTAVNTVMLLLYNTANSNSKQHSYYSTKITSKKKNHHYKEKGTTYPKRKYSSFHRLDAGRHPTVTTIRRLSKKFRRLSKKSPLTGCPHL